MKLTKQKVITLQDTINNPDTQYLFGDNLQKWGKAGQAVIRDAPNAIGIPTKKAPKTNESAYFTDNEYNANMEAIYQAFDRIDLNKNLVMPVDGLGTGLADLKNKAPKTFAYLQEHIRWLESHYAYKKPTRKLGL